MATTPNELTNMNDGQQPQTQTPLSLHPIDESHNETQDTVSICPVCKCGPEVDPSVILECNACKQWIHPHCNNIPDFLALTYMKTRRAFTCEISK